MSNQGTRYHRIPKLNLFRNTVALILVHRRPDLQLPLLGFDTKPRLKLLQTILLAMINPPARAKGHQSGQ
jgi:hypothetical protein